MHSSECTALPEIFKLRELLILLFAHDHEIENDGNCFTIRKRENSIGIEITVIPDALQRYF